MDKRPSEAKQRQISTDTGTHVVLDDTTLRYNGRMLHWPASATLSFPKPTATPPATSGCTPPASTSIPTATAQEENRTGGQVQFLAPNFCLASRWRLSVISSSGSRNAVIISRHPTRRTPCLAPGGLAIGNAYGDGRSRRGVSHGLNAEITDQDPEQEQFLLLCACPCDPWFNPLVWMQAACRHGHFRPIVNVAAGSRNFIH